MLRSGQAMVRADDGMRGVVEQVAMPGFEQHTELRVVYVDRGEKRIAGKREVWNEDKPVPRKLRGEEIALVAATADERLRALDTHQVYRWWDAVQAGARVAHDPELVELIVQHLQKRG